MKEVDDMKSSTRKALRVLSIMLICVLSLCVFGCSDEDAQSSYEEPTENIDSSQQAIEEDAVEVEVEVEAIYPDDEKINSFVIAFNEAYPDMALATEDLVPSYHHGGTHPEQVETVIDGMKVTISSTFSSGSSFEVSVFYAAYQDSLDDIEANHRLFCYCMHVFDPELSDDEIEARWQETVDKGYSPHLSWEDGIEIDASTGTSRDYQGDFEYFKITG